MLLAQALPPLWIFYLIFVGPLLAVVSILLLPLSLCCRSPQVPAGLAFVLLILNLCAFMMSFLEIKSCYGISATLFPLLLGCPEWPALFTWWLDPLFYLLASLCLIWPLRLGLQGKKSPTEELTREANI